MKDLVFVELDEYRDIKLTATRNIIMERDEANALIDFFEEKFQGETKNYFSANFYELGEKIHTAKRAIEEFT